MVGQIERIRIFVEVAERESFAAAARALGLSRSVVTRYIAELEEALGVQLMTRTTRRVTLSTAGMLYLERMKKLLGDLSQTEELVRQQELTLKGSLRVAAPLSFGLRFLPDAIRQFRLLYPEIDLKVDLNDGFIDIQRGDVDMALRISAPPVGKSLIWRKLCVVPRLLVASPAYLAHRDTPKTPEDLADHACMGYSNQAEGTVWYLRHKETGERASVALRSSFSCNNGDLLSDLAVRGEGIALLPRFIAAGPVERGELVALLDDWTAREIWLAAHFPPYDHLPAKVKMFARFIEERIDATQHLWGPAPVEPVRKKAMKATSAD